MLTNAPHQMPVEINAKPSRYPTETMINDTIASKIDSPPRTSWAICSKSIAYTVYHNRHVTSISQLYELKSITSNGNMKKSST